MITEGQGPDRADSSTTNRNRPSLTAQILQSKTATKSTHTDSLASKPLKHSAVARKVQKPQQHSQQALAAQFSNRATNESDTKINHNTLKSAEKAQVTRTTSRKTTAGFINRQQARQAHSHTGANRGAKTHAQTNRGNTHPSDP